MKRYLCKEDCFNSILCIRYEKDKFYDFPDNAKVSHHFIEVSKEKKDILDISLKRFGSDLEELKKLKNPHASQLQKIKEMEAKIAEIEKKMQGPEESKKDASPVKEPVKKKPVKNPEDSTPPADDSSIKVGPSMNVIPPTDKETGNTGDSISAAGTEITPVPDNKSDTGRKTE